MTDKDRGLPKNEKLALFLHQGEKIGGNDRWQVAVIEGTIRSKTNMTDEDEVYSAVGRQLSGIFTDDSEQHAGAGRTACSEIMEIKGGGFLIIRDVWSPDLISMEALRLDLNFVREGPLRILEEMESFDEIDESVELRKYPFMKN